MKRRPIRDGLDAVLRGFPTIGYQRLRCALNLMELTANF